jgi:hypothetical protein
MVAVSSLPRNATRIRFGQKSKRDGRDRKRSMTMSRKAQEAKVRTGFAEPMKRAGFVPPTPEFLDILVEELIGYGQDELKEAASHIIRTRTFSTYPTAGEIIEAIRQVRLRRLPDATRERLKDGLDHEKKKLARRRACQRIRCTSLADPANKEGWLHGLIDFVADHDRMPDTHEQDALRWTAEQIRDNLDALPKIKPIPKVKGWHTLGGTNTVAALQRFRDAMVKKAEREIFGELTSPPKSKPKSEPDAYAEAMAAAPLRATSEAFRDGLPDLPPQDSLSDQNEPAGL